MHTSKDAIGARCREARIKAGLNQPELGKKTGASKNSISSYEKGRSYPPLDFLAILANLSGVTLDWLITGRGEMFPAKKMAHDEFDFTETIGVTDTEAKSLSPQALERIRDIIHDDLDKPPSAELPPQIAEDAARHPAQSLGRAYALWEGACDEMHFTGSFSRGLDGNTHQWEIERYVRGELTDQELYEAAKSWAARLLRKVLLDYDREPSRRSPGQVPEFMRKYKKPYDPEDYKK